MQLFDQHASKLATMVSVVAVVLMSLSVASTVLFVVNNQSDNSSTQVRPEIGEPVRDKPSIEVSNLNLFGVADQSAPKPVDAPKTNLNLELQGVFMAEDPDESTAIVAERNKSGELYQIGNRLPGSAILDSVFEDHILLRRGGRLEKLLFSDASLRQQFSTGNNSSATPNQSLAPNPNDTNTRLQDLRERINARRAGGVSATDNTSYERPSAEPQQPGEDLRAKLSDYRDRLGQEPDTVLQELGVAPVSPGEANGYQIAGDVQEQYLNQVGLKKGDVVLSVNGSPVGDVQNDQALIDQALEAGRVRVEIQRQERRFFLMVPIP